MNRILVPFTFLLCSIASRAQIAFERGYFIGVDDQKVECLIRFVDKKNTPQYFDYKISSEGEIRKGDIANMKEFAIGDIAKYVRAVVDIDRSGQEVQDLTTDRNPAFSKETLFLNLLVEGEISLYSYTQNLVEKYYYSREGGTVRPLVYKAYKTKSNQVAFNLLYKQQLLDELVCDEKRQQSENLRYRQRDLMKLFIDYYTCKGSTYAVFDDKKKNRDFFHLSVRPRVSSGSAKAEWIAETLGFEADFGSSLRYGVGIEAEFVLPFNRNKWAVTMEPTFNSPFKAKRQIEKEFLRDRDLYAEMTYKSVDVPVGIRYYMFLKKGTKVFVNAAYAFGFNGGSQIEFSGSGVSFYPDPAEFGKGAANHTSFGAGVKFGKRVSLEARYRLRRNISGGLMFWNIPYSQSVMGILGVSIF